MCKELLNDVENVDCENCKYFEECDGDCLLDKTCECEDDKEPIYYSEEEVVDIVEECISQIIPKVVVDFEPVQGVTVFDDGFIDGVSDASYICGFYSALVSAGMSPKDAYELTLNESTSRANIRLAEVQQPQTTITAMQNSI